MNGEIEKMMEIRDKATPEQKTMMDQAMSIFKTSFEELIENSRIYLLTGQKQPLDFSAALEALHTVKACADDVGIEFPNIENQKDAILYITKFGKEIVLS